MFKRLATATFLLLSFAPAAAASSITVGNPLSGEVNTFPFGGTYADGQGATEYQQVYEGSLFGPGIYTVTSVSFYPGIAGGINADGTYSLSLSTTSAAVNGLSSTFSSNVGPDSSTFFDSSLPAFPAAHGLMTFVLPTSFNFDPTKGNLLLDVQFSGVTNDSSAFYVAQTGDFGSLSSRMVNGTATQTALWGLVTTFDAAAAPVPEPISALLFGTGLGISGLARLRQRKAR